jgi:hypothetical protein
MIMFKSNLLIILFLTLFLIAPLSIKAATLYLMPPSQSVYQGEAFIIDISLDTEGENINAVEGNLKFLSDSVEIIDLSKGGSFLTLWAQEPEVKDGKISFIGGAPGGFKGNGPILRITFLRKEVGKIEFNFGEDSKVLLNDGNGTPDKLTFLGGSYEVLERPKDLVTVSSSTHPEQNKWYKSSTLHLHWDLISGAEYSYILSKDPSAEPDNTPDKPEGDLTWIGDMEYANLEDGIYYFFLKQKLSEKDWSPKVTFRAMIDTTPPEEFKPEIGEIEGKKYLVFLTTDKISGVDHYEIAIVPPKPLFGPAIRIKWEKRESPYLLGDKGQISKIFVKAVDKAGNEQISEITLPSKPFPYWVIIPVLLILILIWLIIKKYLLRRYK